MQNVIKRVFIGFKKGYQTPSLPDHIIKLQAHPLIRIFRVIGGVSFLSMISNSHLHLNTYILYLVFFISIFFTIYQFYILYHRIKHMRKVLKSDKLEVRNSPLDRLAFLSAKAIYCFKIGCDAAPHVGLALGLMVGVDEVLKNAEHSPVFMPILGGIVKTFLPTNTTNESPFKLIQDAMDSIKANNSLMRNNISILDQLKALNFDGELTQDELVEMEELLNNNQDSLKNQNSEFKSKILELLDKS